MIWTTLPLWLVAHYLGDLAFQTDRITRKKGELWTIMVGHSAIYAGAFALVGIHDWLIISVLFATHFVIDSVKARWGITQRYLDHHLSRTAQEVEEFARGESKARKKRVEGWALYIDQAVHFLVLLSLFVTRGQSFTLPTWF